jgi:hypothetical protein
MNINTEYYKTSRFAIAQKNNDLKINTIVKVVYYLSFKTKCKIEPKINNSVIEVKSLSGSKKYEVIEIKFKVNKIFFLKSGELYFIDLNKSIFDFI